ncbi:hypothetical protein CAAN1_03S04522 [[Candida] anglica]|uniref:Uncharacterized protein n=1 Tax=[Candida] anglica TaxID=148631 RepID=A0ABP0EKK5_9ASCO
MANILNDNKLFLEVPQTVNDEIIEDSTYLKWIQKGDYKQSIDATYNLLQSNDLSFPDGLKIWEIRLMLHLFNNKLGIAKKEAINLNNALYLKETPNFVNSSDGIAKKNPSVPLQPIYPLPKNNDGIINSTLLILLLRLKSIPNLNLVNEIYKLCYQIRLKSTDIDDKLKLQLVNLSYEIIVILTVTKNYSALSNYIQSIRYELELETNDRNAEPYKTYYSNLSLIWLLNIFSQHSKHGNLNNISSQYQNHFNSIEKTSINSLEFVLNTFKGSISVESELPSFESPLTLNGLVELVISGKITGRVICCTLGIWNLMNREEVGLEGIDDVIGQNEKETGKSDEKNEKQDEDQQDDIECDTIQSAYSITVKKWGQNINRVYCLE